MLINFKIKNFRSIKDEITLDLQATSDKTMANQSVFESSNVSLLKSTAIYGPNASGKSNIFKAFMIFRTMVIESLMRSNMPNPLPNEYFKLSNDTKDKSSSFEMTFIINDEIFIYGFEINKQAITSEWLNKDKGKINLFRRKNQEIISNKNSFKEATAVLKKQTTQKALFLSVLASNNGEISKQIVKFIQNTNYVSGADRGNTLNFSFGQFIDNPMIAKKMKSLMIKADFGITDIKANKKMVYANEIKDLPDKFKDQLFKKDSQIAKVGIDFYHKKHIKEENKIENVVLDFFTEESEGTQQMFALSAPILDTLENGKILFIDEIDSSLHPILCQHLITLFNSKKTNKKNAQLVFSTHDTSLMSEELLRRDQINFTNKNEQGMTELFSLADISERKGVDFAKRYLEGRYSAVPYINNFEDIKTDK